MARNIKARRKLSDLYKTGVELRFDADGGHIGPFLDDDGKPVEASEDQVAMWVGPPSPLQREMSLREAQAMRARALIRTKREDDSEEQLTSKAFLAEMSRDTLIDYLLITDQEERRTEAIRDVLSRPEWKDITELQDAMRQFDEAKTPDDDPDFAALLERDAAYGNQVSEREMQLTEASREAMALLGREEMEKRGLEKRADLVGSQAFMQEYERQMTYSSVRDIDNHDLLFFDSALDFADADDIIRDTIAEALNSFISDGAEAKNSPGAASSSDSSTPPSEPEISEASTPAESTESPTSPGTSKRPSSKPSRS